MGASHYHPSGTGPLVGLRTDEHAVRLLFVEHSPDYAQLVCETLDKSSHGHFDVRHAPGLDSAANDLATGEFDALLLDLTRGANSGEAESIESASKLANRLPVIVLTGSEDEPPRTSGLATAVELGEAAVRERIARSRLPDAILRAVRRHRRVGQQDAAEPIVLRDPLRALAKTFARLCRPLSSSALRPG
jgi:DNA-binding response OmpR family regulator